MTADIGEVFDLLNHLFLITVLDDYGFNDNFFKRIQIRQQNQESCVVIGGTTRNYFKLERCTIQDDPISAYMFLLGLETTFLFIMH